MKKSKNSIKEIKETEEFKLNIKLVKTKTEEFLDSLRKKYKITRIDIDFDGSGDSGELGSVSCFNTKDSTNEINISDDESIILSSIFEAYLESTGYDWYNNDGGFGNIILDLETGEIKCDMNIRTSDSENYPLKDEGYFIKNYKL